MTLSFSVMCDTYCSRGGSGATSDGADALLFYHETMSESDAEFLLRATATDGLSSTISMFSDVNVVS